MTIGTVTQVQGGRYQVALDGGQTIEASLRGRIKTQVRTGERLVIGDRVRVGGSGDGGQTIDEAFPREAELVRRGPGGRRPKLLAANLDRLVVVVAAVSPDIKTDLVDRLLAVSESSGIPSVLVVNKIDLPGALAVANRLTQLYRGIGYDVLPTSVGTGEGLDALRELICEGSSALIGPSGAGKSSLLNAIEPSLNLRVGEVSKRIGRGKHTTVTSRLIALGCGGWVADTPGFGDVGLWGVEQSALDGLFPDFRPYLGSCRFRGCSHTHEPGCGVSAAVEAGHIDAGRYGSYKTLRTEAE